MEGRRPPKVPEMLKERGTHLVKLYNGCLSADSAKRPSLEQVVQHFSPNLAPTPSPFSKHLRTATEGVQGAVSPA